jgi:L-asparaginase
MKPTVYVYALGGTIAMTSTNEGHGVEPVLDARALLGGVPGVDQVARIEAGGRRPVAGAHLRLGDLIAVARHLEDVLAGDVVGDVDGIVITQGTDTIEETAFALDLLTNADKPIVVTGAMRNPAQVGAEGPANLLNAVRVAASERARGLGVVVTMNDEIHAARFVRKAHASRPSAFTSPVVGPIGWVAEDRVRVPLRPSGRLHIDVRADAEPPPVALVTVAIGDDARVLGYLRALGYAGVVVAGFGVGHVPEWLVEEAERLARSIPVLLASRTGAGEGFRETYGFRGSERDLLSRGLLSAGSLDPYKARVLLSFALAADWRHSQIACATDWLSS